MTEVLCSKCRRPTGPRTLSEMLADATANQQPSEPEPKPPGLVEAERARDEAQRAFDAAHVTWSRVTDAVVKVRRRNGRLERPIPDSAHWELEDAEQTQGLAWREREQAGAMLKAASIARSSRSRRR